MDYVSASGLMLRKMGYRDPGDNKLWIREMNKITALRKAGAVDEAVNEALLARAEEVGPSCLRLLDLALHGADLATPCL